MLPKEIKEVTEKQMQIEIIKILPDDWSYTKRCTFFEKIADYYRKKSRKEVSEDTRRFQVKKGKDETTKDF